MATNTAKSKIRKKASRRRSKKAMPPSIRGTIVARMDVLKVGRLDLQRKLEGKVDRTALWRYLDRGADLSSENLEHIMGALGIRLTVEDDFTF